MTTKNKAFQRLVVAGYLGLTLLFILIYFMAGYMPESIATLGKLLQDVALNLTIALTISFGSYALLRPFIEDSNRKTLEDFQTAALELLTLEKGVREAGVVRIYETLDDTVLQERLAKAKERVLMMVIWIDSAEKRFSTVFEELCKKQVAIQILQAKPDSEISKIRAASQKTLFPEESSFELSFVTNIVKANNTYFTQLKDKTGGNIQVKAFDVLPPFSLILIDDCAFIRFYGYGKRVSATPHIEFRLDATKKEFSFFGEFILGQFEAIWQKSDRVV
jgi:hypothetical protein